MIYKDLLKINIYIIAVKLFIDCVSQMPERIYTSFLAGNWMTNVLLYLCLNLLITFLLFRFNNYLVNNIFLKKKNYLTDDTSPSSVIRIAIIICSYYIIITTGFALVNNMFSTFKVDFTMIGKVISLIISVFLLFFSDIIAKKSSNE